MQIPSNPLLKTSVPVTIAPDCIENDVIKRPIKRKTADIIRQDNANTAIAKLERDGMELFGLTKGQFSLSDLLQAVLDKTGPAALAISTWTAAHADVERMMQLLESGKIVSCRWLVDQTFTRRAPALAAEIRRKFGDDAMRVTRTHAKFATITNQIWQVAIRSSMNLNQNPRLESFQLGHDPELCKFLDDALDNIWEKQPKSLQETYNSKAVTEWWINN